MRDYVFNMKGYTIALPSAKASDFQGKLQYGGKKAWQGVMHYNKDITLYLENHYHITIRTPIKLVCMGRERELENGNINYLRSKIRIDKSDKLYIKRYGKENYLCQSWNIEK
jgi:hypothetical protein